MILQKPKKRVAVWLAGALIVTALAGLAAYFFWDYSSATLFATAEPPQQQAVTISTDRPVEKQPATHHEYTVPHNSPRVIEIPDLGKSGFIQPVGLDQHGAIAVPSNIHFVGWYTQSARPGEKGLSIIDGHVRGRYSEAIFSKLSELKQGAKFRIQKGDLSWITYTVTNNQTYSAKDAAAPLFRSVAAGTSELRLITCAGTYNSRENSYDKRVIVSAHIEQTNKEKTRDQ